MQQRMIYPIDVWYTDIKHYLDVRYHSCTLLEVIIADEEYSGCDLNTAHNSINVFVFVCFMIDRFQHVLKE
jgi:hypothetical protein